MKKKLVSIFAAVCAACITAGFAACEEETGASTPVWTMESVYATAQELGFEGTLEEFKATIKGADGKDGVGIKDMTASGGVMTVTLTDDTTKVFDFGLLTCAHDYGAWQAGLEESCTSLGYDTRSCTLCGCVDYRFTAATGHTGEWEEILHTCGDMQIKEFACETCGDIATDVDVLAFEDGVCTGCGEAQAVIEGTWKIYQIRHSDKEDIYDLGDNFAGAILEEDYYCFVIQESGAFTLVSYGAKLGEGTWSESDGVYTFGQTGDVLLGTLSADGQTLTLEEEDGVGYVYVMRRYSDSQVAPTETVAEKNERIFQAVKAAYAATLEYKGTLTVDKVMEMEQVGYEGTTYQTQKMTMNGDTYELFDQWLLWNSAAPTVVTTEEEKQFVQDGAYYLYEHEQTTGEEPSNTESYVKLRSWQPWDNYDGRNGTPDDLSGTGGVLAADSATDFANAYRVVCNAKSNEELAKEGVSSVSVSHNVFFTEKDGVATVRSYIRAEKTQSGYDTMNYVETSYSAKDGKLVGWSMIAENSVTAVGATEPTEGSKMVGTVAYSYDFDEELFDSCAAVAPAGTAEELFAANHYTPKFYINGVDMLASYSAPSSAGDLTVAEAFADLAQDACKDSSNVTVCTVTQWYLDEACTQPFDPATTSLDEWFTIDALYAGGVQIDTGYILVSNRVLELCADNYDIVQQGWLARRSWGYYSLPASGTWNIESGDGAERTITVNGATIPSDTTCIEVVGGGTYVIEITEYRTDFNIFAEPLM